MIADDVAVFRRFNRMYTRFLGTLDEHLLDSPFSLAQARALYEIANRNSPRAKEIADELGMDAGYLSRILGKFETEGLLKRTTSKQDARHAELTLTAQGRSAFRKLNALSESQGRTVLERMPPTARSQFIYSLQTVDRILNETGDASPSCVLRPHRIGDMGWVVHREGIVYAEEYGWDETFEALVARIVDAFITNFDSKCERCWIAETDGQSVGHVFLVKHPDDPHTAKLRLLFVEPSARGLGLGHALVNECVQFARTAGYKKIVLWTQSILVAAHRIYDKAEFHLVKEEPHHSFGKDLIGQTWELDFD